MRECALPTCLLLLRMHRVPRPGAILCRLPLRPHVVRDRGRHHYQLPRLLRLLLLS